MTILGLDAGSPTLGEAEHLLHLVVKVLGLPGGTVGCTHFVRTGRPHVACSLAVSGPVDPAGLPEGVSAAIGESRTGPESEGAALVAAEHAIEHGDPSILAGFRAMLDSLDPEDYRGKRSAPFAFIEAATGMRLESEWLDVEEAPVVILDNPDA